MNIGCESGRVAADGEKLNYCRAHDRECVNVLLDISEETAAKDQDAHELHNHTDQEQCIQGWGRCHPFSCLLLAQQKSRKSKQKVTDSHCLLCAELRSLKLSELSAEEPFKNEEFHNRTLGTTSFSSEEEPFNFKLQERSIVTDNLGNQLHFESKALQPLHPQGLCPLLKDRNVGRVALAGSHIVLPPVRRTSPDLMIQERPEVCSLTPIEEEESSTVIMHGDTRQTMVLQDRYHLLSALPTPLSWRVQMPIDTLPHDSLAFGRKLRHQLIRSPPRQNSWQRLNEGLRSRTMRREEPRLPMLLGTRVQIPVSTHRIL